MIILALLLIPLVYIVGVALHEGAHALAAKLMGLEVVRMTLWPGKYPRNGAFHFGRTDVRGLATLSRERQQLFYLAPKILNLVVLLVFTWLELLAWPGSEPFRLVLAVIALGQWVDFSKSLLTHSTADDVVLALALSHAVSREEQAPVRRHYLGMSLAMAYPVVMAFRLLA